MDTSISKERDLSSEFIFSTSRSSGPGGQNVNKVSSKVELRFHIRSSKLLSDIEKEILHAKLATKINSEGYLIIVSQSERSQIKNKENTITKFYSVIANALKPKKKRKPTKPSKSSQEKRLQTKKIHSEKKLRRKDKIF